MVRTTLVLATLLASCATEVDTGVLVHLHFAAGAHGDQVRLTGLDGAAPRFGPSDVLETPRAIGDTSETILVRIDLAQGRTLALSAELRAQGEVVARGTSAPVEIVPGRFVEAALTFTPIVDCAEQGRLPSDVDDCGAPLDDGVRIQQAIDAQALSDGVGAARVRIPAGAYVLDQPLRLGAGRPIDLGPLDGVVTLSGAGILITGPGHTLRALQIRDVQAVAVHASETATGVSIFDLDIGCPVDGSGILLEGADARIEGNHVTRAPTLSRGQRAIDVRRGPAVVALNTIYGAYETGLSIGEGTQTAIAVVDHNSIWIHGRGIGLAAHTARLCLRDNIVFGDGTTSGLKLDETVVLGAGECGGVGSGANAVYDHVMNCTHATSVASCALACPTARPGEGPACDLLVDAGFTDERLCLGASAKPLIDAARTRDYVLTTPCASPGQCFVGGAPDIGAREAGGARAAGGVMLACEPVQ